MLCIYYQKLSENTFVLIKEFVARHMLKDPECLFVLKFPFATNGFHMISKISGFDTILYHIDSMYKDQFGRRYPYVMLQRYHKNLVEKKVVVCDGKAMYVASSKVSRGKVCANKQELMQFAETAVSMLKTRCPETCIDGLIRVDIMFSNDENKMIVNEFESLEANFYSKKHGIEEESKVKVFLTKFWATELAKFIEI